MKAPETGSRYPGRRQRHGSASGPWPRWTDVAGRLRLRLRPGPRPDHVGPLVGTGLQATLIIVDHDLVIPVRPWMVEPWGADLPEVVERAGRNTSHEPRRVARTTVESGDDAGSTLLVVAGGAATSGLVAALDRIELAELRLPALVSIPNDEVVVIGVPAARRSAPAVRALADRLLTMQRALDDPGSVVAAHRRLLWCHPSGLLSMFGVEDSWNP